MDLKTETLFREMLFYVKGEDLPLFKLDLV